MRFSSAAAAAQLALPSSLVGIDTVPLIYTVRQYSKWRHAVSSYKQRNDYK